MLFRNGLYATGRSALVFGFGATGRVGDFLECGKRAGVLQFPAGRKDNPRFADHGGRELFGGRAAARSQRQAKIADFPELYDPARFQVLVEKMVHAVHDGLHVGACQRAAFRYFLAKLVKFNPAVVHRLRVEFLGCLFLVGPQVFTFDQLVFLCHIMRINEG